MNVITKILIAGSGGVGSYIGAQLIRHTDAEVTLLARGEHLRAIKDRGLTIEEDTEPYTVSPAHATDDPSSLGIYDLIFFTVKGTSLEDTLRLISKNISYKTVIIPLLNGVGHAEYIRQYYPEATVLDGHIYILSNITTPGTIRKRGSVFRLVWGSEHPVDPTIVRALTELFDAAKLRHKHSETITLDSWKKYLFISAFASLTAYHNKSMDAITTEHSDELTSLLHEIVSVAQAKTILLTEEHITAALTQAANVTPGAKTSLQLDIEQGKPSEVEALCGYIVHEGKRLGVTTPMMDQIYSVLKSKLPN